MMDPRAENEEAPFEQSISVFLIIALQQREEIMGFRCLISEFRCSLSTLTFTEYQ